MQFKDENPVRPVTSASFIRLTEVLATFKCISRLDVKRAVLRTCHAANVPGTFVAVRNFDAVSA